MFSCNGLLCMASRKTFNSVLVCNPITREIVMLPASESKTSSHFTVVGLGYDTSTGKYKALRTYKQENDGGMGFEVITFGQSSWREVTAPHGLEHHEIVRPVSWNGILCWLINDLERGVDKCMLAFDLRDETFQILSFPDTDRITLPPIYLKLELVDLRGCLTLIEHHDEHMLVWEVKGNKVGELSLLLGNKYTKHLQWNLCYFSHSLVSMTNHDSWLLQTNAFNIQTHWVGDSFLLFFPKTMLYLPLEIPDLPDRFCTFSFKPTLVSPNVALA